MLSSSSILAQPFRGFSFTLGGTLLCAACILSACAVDRRGRLCTSASMECIAEHHRLEVYDACITSLFSFRQEDRSTQEAIRAEYGYPYTDSETYFRLARQGVRVKSPHAWCDAYARRRSAVWTSF